MSLPSTRKAENSMNKHPLRRLHVSTVDGAPYGAGTLAIQPIRHALEKGVVVFAEPKPLQAQHGRPERAGKPHWSGGVAKDVLSGTVTHRLPFRINRLAVATAANDRRNGSQKLCCLYI
ncbi:hypothetical protein [Paraburkholderia sacchari]|uniref:hypothetical protein n=1 Tax=Paraburkholderia sacchari TaxID=159450 RepID=UPI003D95EA70